MLTVCDKLVSQQAYVGLVHFANNCEDEKRQTDEIISNTYEPSLFPDDVLAFEEKECVSSQMGLKHKKAIKNAFDVWMFGPHHELPFSFVLSFPGNWWQKIHQ